MPKFNLQTILNWIFQGPYLHLTHLSGGGVYTVAHLLTWSHKDRKEIFPNTAFEITGCELISTVFLIRFNSIGRFNGIFWVSVEFQKSKAIPKQKNIRYTIKTLTNPAAKTFSP